MDVYTITHSKWTQISVVGILAAAGGAAAGFLHGRRIGFNEAVDAVNKANAEAERVDANAKMLFTQVINNSAEERAELRQKAGGIVVDAGYLAPDAEVVLVEKGEDIIVDGEVVTVGNTVMVADDETSSPMRHNIFEGNLIEDWDWDVENAFRETGAPYPLHYTEFLNPETDEFHQTQLTYYAKDDVLAGESDDIVPNHTRITGELRFGHGSNDPTIYYCRNVKTRTEYEILLHHGSYAEVVQGLSFDEEIEAQELKHSRNMRFRQE